MLILVFLKSRIRWNARWRPLTLAGKFAVATDVSGIVLTVAVHESQKVEKGQVLFTLGQEPFRIALADA